MTTSTYTKYTENYLRDIEVFMDIFFIKWTCFVCTRVTTCCCKDILIELQHFKCSTSFIITRAVVPANNNPVTIRMGLVYPSLYVKDEMNIARYRYKSCWKNNVNMAVLQCEPSTWTLFKYIVMMRKLLVKGTGVNVHLYSTSIVVYSTGKYLWLFGHVKFT